MAIKVNLISKSRKSTKSKDLVIKVLIGVFGLIFVIFLSSAAYVTLRIVGLKRELNNVSLESLAVSGEIRANNENVNRYVLSKGVLDYLSQIDSAKFNYKKYLDEIVAVLPINLELRGVDFQVKGWVAVTVAVPSLADLKNFEERITDKTILDQTVFTGVFSEGLVKEKGGGYLIKMQFELKKNV